MKEAKITKLASASSQIKVTKSQFKINLAGMTELTASLKRQIKEAKNQFKIYLALMTKKLKSALTPEARLEAESQIYEKN